MSKRCAPDVGQVPGGPDSTGPWNAPARHVEDITTILSTGDGLPLNPNRSQTDGRGANRVVAKVQGKWSSCRVYVDIPVAWAASSDVALSLVALTEGGEHDITGFVSVDSMNLTPAGIVDATPSDQRLKGMAFGVSGMACTGFLIYARSKSNWVNQLAHVTIETWGDDSTYQVIETLGAPVQAGNFTNDRPMPFNGAGMMNFVPSSSKWTPWVGGYAASGGAFAINIGAPIVLAIAEFQNRTNTPNNQPGQTDNRGSVYVLDALPDPTQTATDSPPCFVTAQLRDTAKASPGYAIGISIFNNTAALLYWLLISKTTPPAGGETSIHTIGVPIGAGLSWTFSRPQVCLAGVSFAWSTTPLVLTLPGAANPVTSIYYV